jgi:hypothetical protein
MNNESQANNFVEVHKTEGKSKDKKSFIVIVTSKKGFIYRTEVLLDSYLIDSKEVICEDLTHAEDGERVFKERYMASHKKFEDLYFAEKIFVKVLSDDGQYIENEDDSCSVTTSVYENIIKHDIVVNTAVIDSIENKVDRDLASNKEELKNEYTRLHKEIVEEYINIPKFPKNTILNPILKKYPFYDSKPMYSLYLFILSIAIVLWVLSIIICGKAMKKLAPKVGIPAPVVKDMQKSLCPKGGGDEDETKLPEALSAEEIVEKYGNKFDFFPEQIDFKTTNGVRYIHIKNYLPTELIVELRERSLENFEHPLVTSDMIIKILSPKVMQIKAGQASYLIFQINDKFLKDEAFIGKKFEGVLIFNVIDIRNKISDTRAVKFSFTPQAD